MAATYLYRNQGTPTGDGKKATISMWIKPSYINFSSGTDGLFEIRDPSITASFDLAIDNGKIWFAVLQGSWIGSLIPNFEPHDWNAWMHIVCVYDSAQSTDNQRMIMYINGKDVRTDYGGYSTETYVAQDTASTALAASSSYTQKWARYADTSTYYFDGYMAQCIFVDGEAYQASTFGSTDATTGEWKPKSDGEIRSAVTFGDQGSLLNFSNGSNLGYDYQTSGRSTTNDFTVSGSGYKTLDNPSDNQPTLNQQVYKPSGPTYSFSNANQGLSFSGSDWATIPGTIGPGDSGKWYFEAKQTSLTNYAHMGFLTAANLNAGGFEGYFGQEGGNQPAYGYGQDGKIYYSTTSTNGVSSDADWATFTSGDICMCALDLDNNFIYFGKNGTWGNSGDPTSGATGTGGYAIDNPSGSLWLPGVAGYNATWQTNFGAGYFDAAAVASGESDDGGLGTFEYDVPAGYRTICTKNIKTYG